jgi:hypothetical protein
VASIFVVGKSGAGAEYTTIQSALDAVSAGSSLATPSLVLVGPGVYTENLVIDKDGVFLVGLGGVVIDASAADATVKIQQAVTIPLFCRLQNLRIQNSNVGEECVLVVGGSGSTVGQSEIQILDCELLATGVGAFQVSANQVNRILVQGGSWGGSAATSLAQITQCARFLLRGVDRAVNLQLDYDTVNPSPAQAGSEYRVSGCFLEGNIQSTLTGAGSLVLTEVSGAGDLTVNGDQTCEAVGCSLGNLTVDGTTAATLKDSTRGTLAGTGTMAEPLQEGSVGFAASSSEAVVFGVGHPDANYHVSAETELNEAISVTSKTASGFTLGFAGAQTTTVNFAVFRRV